MRSTSPTHPYAHKPLIEFHEIIVLESNHKTISNTIIHTGLAKKMPEGRLAFLPQRNDALSVCWKNSGMSLTQNKAKKIITLLPPQNEKSTDKTLIKNLAIQSGLLQFNLKNFLAEYYERNLNKPYFTIVKNDKNDLMKEYNENLWEFKFNIADVRKLIELPGTIEYQIASVFKLLRENTEDSFNLHLDLSEPHSLLNLLYEELRFYYFAGMYNNCQSILNEIGTKIEDPSLSSQTTNFLWGGFYFHQATLSLATNKIDDAKENFKKLSKCYEEFYQNQNSNSKDTMILQKLEEIIAIKEKETLTYQVKMFANNANRFIDDLSASVSSLLKKGP